MAEKSYREGRIRELYNEFATSYLNDTERWLREKAEYLRERGDEAFVRDLAEMSERVEEGQVTSQLLLGMLIGRIVSTEESEDQDPEDHTS